jgi:intracellular septation protein
VAHPHIRRTDAAPLTHRRAVPAGIAAPATFSTTETELADPAALPETGPRVHPLVHAGKWLLSDLIATLTFVAIYAVTHSIYIATGLGIAAGVGRIAYLRLRREVIDRMQWLSLGLVIVFGGATLITRDPRFIMVKPTLIYAAIGTVMLLTPGWMNRYVTPIARARAGDVTFVFGYVWAGLMFATGLANIGFAFLAGPILWAWYIGVFPLASKFALVGVQYVVTRGIVRARIRAERGLAPA